MLVYFACIFCLYEMVIESYGGWQSTPLITFSGESLATSQISLPAVSICGSWKPPPGKCVGIGTNSNGVMNEEETQRHLLMKTFCGLADETEWRQIKDFSALWELAGIKVTSTSSLAVFTTPFHFCLTSNLKVGGVFHQENNRYVHWIDKTEQPKSKIIVVTMETQSLDGNVTYEGDFFLMVHNSKEYPFHYKGERTNILKYTSTILTVNAEITESDDDVITLPLDLRYCYFPRERQLQVFRSYTQSNCRSECIMKMDPKYNDCLNLRCPALPSADEYEKYMYSRGVHTNTPCDCVNSCRDVQYVITYVTTEPGMEPKTEVSVSFDDLDYTPKLRSVTCSFVGFLSACGGSLGLFTGLSVLSVFEIVYHCFSSYCKNSAGEDEEEDEEEQEELNLTSRYKVLHLETMMDTTEVLLLKAKTNRLLRITGIVGPVDTNDF